MDTIGQYLLSVTAVAMIGGIAVSICGRKSASGKLIRLLSGMLLTITVVSPFLKMNVSDLTDWTVRISNDADMVTREGMELADQQRRAVIKAEVEAYILDKATSLNMDISAEVILSGEEPPVPESVRITGSASPYAKTRLSHYIGSELGIPEARQQWN